MKPLGWRLWAILAAVCLAVGLTYYFTQANRSTKAFDRFFGAMADVDMQTLTSMLADSVDYDPHYLEEMCQQLKEHHGELSEVHVITAQWALTDADIERFSGSARLFFERGTARVKLGGIRRQGEPLRISDFIITSEGLDRWRTPPRERATYRKQAEAYLRLLFSGEADQALTHLTGKLHITCAPHMSLIAGEASASVGELTNIAPLAEGLHPTRRILHLYFTVEGSAGTRIARVDIGWPTLASAIVAFDINYRGPLPGK